MIAWLMLKTTRFRTDEAKNSPAAPQWTQEDQPLRTP